MKNTIIRWACSEDIPVLLKLIRELAEFEKAPEAVTVTEKEFWDAGFGESPVWKAFVVESALQKEEKQIIGMALFYTRYSTWKGRILYLEDIIVTASCRGKGVGRALLEQVEDYARKNGFKGMRWQVLDWNQPAIDFYAQHQGCRFDKSWLNIDLTLPG